jgi:hypothetical protein
MRHCGGDDDMLEWTVQRKNSPVANRVRHVARKSVAAIPAPTEAPPVEQTTNAKAGKRFTD